jgi:hypothetical protein
MGIAYRNPLQPLVIWGLLAILSKKRLESWEVFILYSVAESVIF